jgi:hypothetical protein
MQLSDISSIESDVGKSSKRRLRTEFVSSWADPTSLLLHVHVISHDMFRIGVLFSYLPLHPLVRVSPPRKPCPATVIRPTRPLVHDSTRCATAGPRMYLDEVIQSKTRKSHQSSNVLSSVSLASPVETVVGSASTRKQQQLYRRLGLRKEGSSNNLFLFQRERLTRERIHRVVPTWLPVVALAFCCC